MRRYDPGGTATLRQEVRDADEQLVAASVTFSYTPPSGSPTDGNVTNPGTGLYDVSISSLAEGLYRGTWTISGAVNDKVSVQFYVATDIDELPPLASLDRFLLKLGYTPPQAELDRASSLLDDASELIRSVAGKTWVTSATGALEAVPRRVRSVCIEAAFRAFGNPEALSQRSIGDSSKSYDRAGREGGEAVYLTTDEERDIRKAAGTSGLISVGLYGLADYAAVDPWDQVTAE